MGEADKGDRLGDGADLVGFDDDAVARFFFDRALESFHIGRHEIVGDDERRVGETLLEFGPAAPIFLIEAIFDREQTVIFDHRLIECNHTLGI